MTIVELMAAIMVLAIGILATFAVFDVSNRATHVAEKQESEVHQAQNELERLEALPYSQVGLASAPQHSTDPHNPSYYVSNPASGNCAPTFQWNQSAGATSSDQLVVNGCSYNGAQFNTGTIAPSFTKNGYTIYDYVTWVNDSLCAPGVGCPVNDDYKRVTVEVTNGVSGRLAPTSPVLLSAIVADAHALPVVGNPNTNNPLDSTSVTCTNASGQQVICNNGLGNQTPNLFYLTNSLEQNGYSAPTGNNSCMHYTDQQLPLLSGVLSCGGTNLGVCSVVLGTVGCPQPDLLNGTPPPSSITQEYNFSPNLSSGSGRVIKRDTKATSCSATPSNDATMGELWATRPLSAQLNLSGSGSATLFTNTLHGASVSVTLCVGVYLESPVLGILDPLNLLGSSDSVQLGVSAYTMAQWPAVPTPLSFTFNYMSAAHLAAAGSSIAVRLWLTAASADDVVFQYDAPSAASVVEVNSQ